MCIFISSPWGFCIQNPCRLWGSVARSSRQLPAPAPSNAAPAASIAFPKTFRLIPFLDDFPSSAAFEQIASALSASETDRKDALKTGNAIFAFNIKNKDGKQEAWHLDLKESGTVGKGAAPEGKKADVTLTLPDEEFGKLVQGKANAQKLFMSGKLKIKGNVLKATKR